MAEAGEKNAWTPATVEKMEALRVDLKAFKKTIKFEDLTESWFTEKGYNTNKAYKTFRPTLKQTQKKVIYLTKEEIARVRAVELSGDNAYLDPVRDVFIFCCFSGLRHSDANNLRRSDIKAMKPYIDIVDTIKAESVTKFNSLL